MLHLSRRENESVVVGGPVEVYVLEIRRGRVKLGFKASDDVRINRREVHDRIDAEKGNR